MTAFITRQLGPDAVFRKTLTAQGWLVEGQSLVCFEPISFSILPVADWIFFYSQHAVAFFFQNMAAQNLPLPIVQWAVVGKATAAVLSTYIPTIHFTGSGDPVTTATAFQAVAAGNTVLFPGARHSRQSVERLLHQVISGIRLDVYDNRPVESVPARTEKVLVFTSPLNAQTYFARQALQPGQRVVAIGQTTASALYNLGIEQVFIPTEPTETALAELVLSIQVD